MFRRTGSWCTDDQKFVSADRGARDRASELIAGALASQRQQTTTVFARVDISVSRAAVSPPGARRADDDVGVTVAVDVADARRMAAEVVGLAIRLERQQYASVLA